MATLQVILLFLVLSQQLPLPGRGQMLPQLPLPLGRFRFLPPFASAGTPVSSTSRPLSLAESIGRPPVDTSLPANTNAAAVAAADQAIRSQIDACSGVMASAQLGCPCASPGGRCADPLSLCDQRNQCICDGRFGYADATGSRCTVYVVLTTTRTSTSTTITSTTTSSTTTTPPSTRTATTTTSTPAEEIQDICDRDFIEPGGPASAFDLPAGQSMTLTTLGFPSAFIDPAPAAECGLRFISSATSALKVKIVALETMQTNPTAVGTCQEAQVIIDSSTTAATDYTFCSGGNPVLANTELTFPGVGGDVYTNYVLCHLTLANTSVLCRPIFLAHWLRRLF